MTLLTLKETEQRIGLRTGTLADCFFRGVLPDTLCIWVGCKRAIDPEAVPLINEALRRAGKLPKPAVLRA